MGISKTLLVILPLFELPLVDSLLIMDRGTLWRLFFVGFVFAFISLGASDMFTDRRGQREVKQEFYRINRKKKSYT